MSRGGTDLYPNMKRRQQTPGTVISAPRLKELHECGRRREWRSSAPRSFTDICNNPVISAIIQRCRAARRISHRLCAIWERSEGNCFWTLMHTTIRMSGARESISLKKDGDLVWWRRAVRSAGRSSSVCSGDGRDRRAVRLVPQGASAAQAADFTTTTYPVPDQASDSCGDIHCPAAASPVTRRQASGSFDFPVLGGRRAGMMRTEP